MSDSLPTIIQALGPCDVLTLTTSLLQYCRRTRSELENAFRRGDQRGAHTSCRKVIEHFITAHLQDDEELDQDDLTGFAGVLGMATQAGGHPSIVAHAAATELDRSYGDRFFAMFQERGAVQTLKPGASYPVTSREHLYRVFQKRITPDPDGLDALDGVRHLRLVPQSTTIGLRFDTTRRAHLAAIDPFQQQAQLAVAVPARDEAYDWDQYPVEDPRHFYDVRPKDAAVHWDRIARLLRAAEERDARFVMLPELATTTAIVDRIAAWLETARSVRWVVAGSCHLARADKAHPGTNESTALLRPAARLSHHKFNPFDLSGVIEHIEADAHVTIHACQQWSLAIVVCKDFLQTEVARLLSDLRVRLLVVPAFSPKPTIFQVRAGDFAIGAQAVAVVANTPHGEDGTVAILGRPMEGAHLLEVKADPRAGLLVTFSLDGHYEVLKLSE